MSAYYKMAEMTWIKGWNFDASVTAERQNTVTVCSNGMFLTRQWHVSHGDLLKKMNYGEHVSGGYYHQAWSKWNIGFSGHTSKRVHWLMWLQWSFGYEGHSRTLVTNNYGYCNILVTVVTNHYGPKRTFSKVENIQKSKTWTILANKCYNFVMFW